MVKKKKPEFDDSGINRDKAPRPEKIKPYNPDYLHMSYNEQVAAEKKRKGLDKEMADIRKEKEKEVSK